MTKKDFELIAKIIKQLNYSAVDRQYIANAFATYLQEQETNFDSKKFLKACEKSS